MVNLYYAIPRLDLKSSLRTCKSDIESIDMPARAREHTALTVFIIHGVNEPKLIPLALLTPDMSMSSSSKSMALGSIHLVSLKSSGPRVKHTPT